MLCIPQQEQNVDSERFNLSDENRINETETCDSVHYAVVLCAEWNMLEYVPLCRHLSNFDLIHFT